jgi:hypothetical protein
MIPQSFKMMAEADKITIPIKDTYLQKEIENMLHIINSLLKLKV